MSEEITLDSFKNNLEKIKNIDENGVEFWFARDLQKQLGYKKWSNFESIVNKAKISCETSKIKVSEHFADVGKTIKMPNMAEKSINDFKLTRYACYLIAQNGDVRKKEIAFAQTYFAIQTRKQELQEDFIDFTEEEQRVILRKQVKSKNSQLFDTVKNIGVESNTDFAIFNNFGYKGLYNGLGAKEIAQKKNVKPRAILDFMGSTELAANLFRITQANDKIKNDNITNKQEANTTHYKAGVIVRKAIKEMGGTMPEDLPAYEDVKKVERRIEKGKKISKKEIKKIKEQF